LAEHFNKSLAYISADPKKSERFYEDIIEFKGTESAAFFPELNQHPFEHRKPNPGRISLRVEALAKLAESKIVISSISGLALIDKLPDPDKVKKSCFTLNTGEEYDLEFLIEELSELGFQRVDIVDQMGEFAVRGGIVDVFSWTGESPHRLEFWGDVIESIRTFDVLTQRSVEKVGSTEILGTDSDFVENIGSIFDYINNAIIWIDEPHILENRLKDQFG